MQKKTILFSLFFSAFCFTIPAGAQTASENSTNMNQQSHMAINVKPYSEDMVGKPGYKAEVNFLEVDSASNPRVSEIGQFVNASVLAKLFDTRQDSLGPTLSTFCEETERDEDACANELNMKVKKQAITGNILSIRYDYSYFTVGAAHPMHDVETFNFALRPVFEINKLENIFEDSDTVFPKIQKFVRDYFMTKKDQDDDIYINEDNVNDGTQEWEDFENFMFSKDGITFIFPPYQVAAYAYGTQEVTIPYSEFKDELKPFYQKALQLK